MAALKADAGTPAGLTPGRPAHTPAQVVYTWKTSGGQRGKAIGGTMPQVDELKTDVTGDGLQNGSGAEHSKVLFNPEQQAKVQELIDEAYRKAYAKAQRSRPASEETETLRGEVKRLRDDKKMAGLYR